MSEVIGREGELAAVETFVDLVKEGPAALVLFGEAGIGKTTLWREGMAAANRRSVSVLSCRPTESETQLPYAGLGDLFSEVGEDILASLPGPQRAALEAALLRARSLGPPLEQRAVATAVLGVLTRLARSGPVLVAVDDVQWLDVPSTRALAFALRRVGEAPISTLVNLRGQLDGDAPLGLDRALPDDRLAQLEVGPLPVEALDRLLRARLQTAFLRPVLLQLHRVSGGNPFYALELGRALLRRKAPLRPGETLPVPGTLLGLVTERLARLTVAGRESVLAAAALSRPTLALIRAAGDGIDEALTAGVVEVEEGQVRFTHPLLASAVYSQADAESRRRLHRRLAEVVEDPEERPRHLALGAEGPDVMVASALDEAARRARARGAPDAAAALAEQALRLTPPGHADDVRRRSLEASEYHFHAGDLPRAQVLLEDMLPATSRGSERAWVLSRLGEIRTAETGQWSAEELFQRALAESGDDRSRAQAQLSLAFSAMVGRGDIPKAAGHARAALELAEGLGDDSLLRDALLQVLFYDFLLGRGVQGDLWERAVILEDRVWEGEVATVAGHTRIQRLILAAILKWSDDFEAARERLTSSYRRALEAGDEAAVPYLLYHLSELECWAGNWDLAVRYAEEGCQTAERTAQEDVRAATLYARALVTAHRGEMEMARASAEEGLAMAERMGNLPVALLHRSVLGFLALSVADHAGVHRHLGPLAEGLATMGVAEPAVVRFLPDEIEALVALGDTALATTLVDQLEERGRALDRPWALATGGRCRGLLLAAKGDLDGALGALEGALGAHGRLAQPFELARTLLVRGSVLRRAKHKRAAAESLQEALRLFEDLGARAWAERARGDLGRIGGRAPSPAGLSPTEAKMAELVAAGHTNQEVADLLFISVKTVESNLSRIYRKLGVASRRELARLVGSRTSGS